MKNRALKFIKIILIPLFFLSMGVLLYSCDGLFPTAAKSGIPNDHTNNIGGFMHLGGEDDADPDECDDCHTLDLRGKVSKVNGVYRWAPSCYQCHGKVWEKDGDKAKVNF